MGVVVARVAVECEPAHRMCGVAGASRRVKGVATEDARTRADMRSHSGSDREGKNHPVLARLTLARTVGRGRRGMRQGGARRTVAVEMLAYPKPNS